MPLLFRRAAALLASIPDVAAFQALAVTTASGTARWTRGADLSSNANSKFISFSFWWNPDTVASSQNWYSTGANEVLIRIVAGGQFNIIAENPEPTGATILNIATPAASLTAGVWTHICGSVDMDSSSTRWVRFNGITQTVTNSVFTVGETINWTNANHSIGANPAGGSAWQGAHGEIWIDNTQFIPNTDANVLKFISAVDGTGKAISLGSDGSLPGFGVPKIYLSRLEGEAVSAFAPNQGSGGGFTATGTPGDGGSIPSLGGTGTTPPPPTEFDEAEILSRNPKLYLRLEDNSGNPIDYGLGGYGGAVTMQGAASAYRVDTGQGFGIRLGSGAYIQATHHSVFETPGAAIANTIVESEVTFSIYCAFPATLQDDWVIFSKANSGADLSQGVSLRVHADGSVEMRVRDHRYRPDVRMKAPAGTITVGSEHHFTVSLGYRGAWFTVDGRQAELGFKNTLSWWGLDHRHNGVEENGSAVSTRVTNTSHIRLGRTGDQSTSADIVVTKFAVFYSGATRTTRGQVTAGFTLADCQDIAAASGAVLQDSRWGNSASPNATPSPGNNTISTALAAASSGQCILINGTFTQSVDIVLKAGVRLFSTTGATITFTNDAKVHAPQPAAFPALASGAATPALATGSQTLNITNTLTDDAIFVACHSVALGTLYQVTGVQTPAHKKSDVIPIRSRTGSTITFTRAPYFNYAAGQAVAFGGFNPTVKDIAIDGDITFTKNGGTRGNSLFTLNGVRRSRFSGITVEQTTPPATTNRTLVDILTCTIRACVEMQWQNCEVTDTSPDDITGESNVTSTTHPYAISFAGCAHYDVFDHVGYSEQWHAIDNSISNADDDWGFGGVFPTAQWGGQFGDIRNGTYSSSLGSLGNNFPVVAHTSNHIRMLDLLFSSGGGTSIDGWAHNVECITANSGGRQTNIGHTRGVGGTRIWHCRFLNNLGNWGNGDFGFRKNNYGDLRYANNNPKPPAATQGSNFSPVPKPSPDDNVFTDVDSAIAAAAPQDNNGFPTLRTP